MTLFRFKLNILCTYISMERNINSLINYNIGAIDAVKTDFKHAPWFIVSADDKEDTQINLITHLLNRSEYKHKDVKALSDTCDFVYPATGENIKGKLFRKYKPKNEGYSKKPG